MRPTSIEECVLRAGECELGCVRLTYESYKKRAPEYVAELNLAVEPSCLRFELKKRKSSGGFEPAGTLIRAPYPSALNDSAIVSCDAELRRGKRVNAPSRVQYVLFLRQPPVPSDATHRTCCCNDAASMLWFSP